MEAELCPDMKVVHENVVKHDLNLWRYHHEEHYEYCCHWPLLFGLALGTGCSKKLVQESELDTPQYHVRKGKELIERGDLEGARISFERAQDLDDDFAQAYAGLAIVEALEGEYGCGA